MTRNDTDDGPSTDGLMRLFNDTNAAIYQWLRHYGMRGDMNRQIQGAFDFIASQGGTDYVVGRIHMRDPEQAGGRYRVSLTVARPKNATPLGLLDLLQTFQISATAAGFEPALVNLAADPALAINEPGVVPLELWREGAPYVECFFHPNGDWKHSTASIKVIEEHAAEMEHLLRMASGEHGSTQLQ